MTSLIGAGLPETGMDYDDLILALLADRLDFLFTHRRGVVQHLFELMETPSLFDLMRPETSASEQAKPDASGKGVGAMPALIGEVTDLNVLALNSVLRAAEPREDGAAGRDGVAGNVQGSAA